MKFHLEIIIFELMELYYSVSGKEEVPINLLEEAFYELQDLANSKDDPVNEYTFEEAILYIEEYYSDIFEVSDDFISFLSDDKEIDIEIIFEQILLKMDMLKKTLNEVDYNLNEYKYNIIIFYALNIKIPLDKTIEYFNLNQSIVSIHLILAKHESKGLDTSKLRLLLKCYNDLLAKKFFNMDDQTLADFKICIAHYNGMFLSFEDKPNICSNWYIVLINKKAYPLGILHYDKINNACLKKDLEMERDIFQDNFDDDDDEELTLADIPTETVYIFDEQTYFLSHYLYYLNEYIENINSPQIKETLLLKKHYLLSLGELEETEEYYIENNSIPKPEYNPKWAHNKLFDFLDDSLEEIISNIFIPDIDIDVNKTLEADIITNALIIKCLLSLSTDDNKMNNLIDKITKSKYYNHPDYSISTRIINSIILKENPLKRKREKNELN